MIKHKEESFIPKLNLQLFAEDKEETPDQADNPEETKTDTDTDKSEEKTFRQEDVNNIVAKESKKATEKLLKELGIEDFNNAKEGLTKFKEWQESQKTEQEKQKDALENLEKDKNTLLSEKESLAAQLAALKQGVVADSVEDVVALAERLVSDEKTIDEAIKEVIEKYPHFAKQEEEQEEEDKPFFTTKSSKTSEKGDAFTNAVKKITNR